MRTISSFALPGDDWFLVCGLDGSWFIDRIVAWALAIDNDTNETIVAAVTDQG